MVWHMLPIMDQTTTSFFCPGIPKPQGCNKKFTIRIYGEPKPQQDSKESK